MGNCIGADSGKKGGKAPALDPSDLIGEHWGNVREVYDYRKTLGEGSYGKVYYMKNKKTAASRAIKQVNKEKLSAKEVQALKSEFTILRGIDHPNIVKVFDLYEDQRAIYIVTELLEGGELFDEIVSRTRFEERHACDVIRTMLQAINYCHAHGIVHRDLKPENVLFAKKGDPTIKIVDFGCSRRLSGNMNELIGTPYYLAPEVIKKNYNEKCDVWSIGVILYILLTGTPPFGGANNKQIMETILRGQFDRQPLVSMHISAAGQDLVNLMLKMDPAERPSAKQCLEHRWFSDKFTEPQPREQVEQAIRNIRTFFKQSKLLMAVQYYIFNQYENKDDATVLTKIFKEMDKNGDGSLSREEIESAIRKHNMSEDNAKLFEELLEGNHGESINYTEFVVAASGRRNMLYKERIDEVFQMIDRDGSGQIDVSEMRGILTGYSNQEVEEMFAELGIRDGKINIERWRKLMDYRLSQV